MSAFGDHTPKQDLLDAIDYVRDEHNLTWLQTIKLLIQVMEYITQNLMEGE